MAKCKYCGKEIFWVKEGRKNIPFEEGGDEHSCEERKTSLKSYKVMNASSLSPEEIAKYESAMNKAAQKQKKKSTK